MDPMALSNLIDDVLLFLKAPLQFFEGELHYFIMFYVVFLDFLALCHQGLHMKRLIPGAFSVLNGLK